MSNETITENIWLHEDLKVVSFEGTILVPNFNLEHVPYVTLNSESDFEKIPAKGGCYWIWTNEPIIHSLHKRATPKKFENGEIIYNGIAQDDVRGRVKHHLLGDINAGWSGISVDVLPTESKSHRKKVMSELGKVPYIENNPIRNKDMILKLNLSKDEITFIHKSNQKIFYFRNGINIFENKHKKYEYRVYFIVGLKSLSYLEIIEKKWRRVNGSPKLCSYLSGR